MGDYGTPGAGVEDCLGKPGGWDYLGRIAGMGG